RREVNLAVRGARGDGPQLDRGGPGEIVILDLPGGESREVGRAAVQCERRRHLAHKGGRVPGERLGPPAHGAPREADGPFVWRRLAWRGDDGLHTADHVTAVGPADFLLLQEGDRRQENVRIPGRVGHDLLAHHGEQIFARQAAQDRALVGGGDGGVTVV